MLRIDVRASPILSFPLCCANTIGPAIRNAPVGEAQRIKKNPQKLLIGAAKVPHFAFKRRVQRTANNVSTQRQYSWRHVAHSALPIYPELAYNLGSTDWKRNYGKNKMKAKESNIKTPSATVPGPYTLINTIFDPPYFSLDATFKD